MIGPGVREEKPQRATMVKRSDRSGGKGIENAGRTERGSEGDSALPKSQKSATKAPEKRHEGNRR